MARPQRSFCRRLQETTLQQGRQESIGVVCWSVMRMTSACCRLSRSQTIRCPRARRSFSEWAAVCSSVLTRWAMAVRFVPANNVTKGQICTAIREKELTTPGQVKSCTKAGTGCGGCMPLVTDILHAELKAAGIEVKNHLCEHFPYSRTELFAIIKAKQLKTFDEIIAHCGTGSGCEVCKPAVTSILAVLFNENIMQPQHQTLQDTNDRFLANTQRDGSFSVIPRVAGGEITPDKLIVLGEVAKKYGLYTKITGGQAYRSIRCKNPGLTEYLGRTCRSRFRERPCVRQGIANREELRRRYMVSLRRAGLRGLRDSNRESLQGPACSA